MSKDQTWTVTSSPAEVVGYQMVKGPPLDVEIGVNTLIKEGFVLNGPLFEYVTSTGHKIFVQSMVKYGGC